MRPFRSLIPFDEALKKALEASEPVTGTETLSLSDTEGRILAADLISPMDVPGYDRAAMDGYALHSGDTLAASQGLKVLLRVTTKIFAGGEKPLPITEGECAQIATGGMLPEGADAVVPFEKVELRDGFISLTSPMETAFCIGAAGEDMKEGEIVLSAGTHLNASQMGTAAAVGRAELECYRKPVLAVAVSGDEVVQPGEPLEPGQIYDTNSYTIQALASRAGAEVKMLPLVRDVVGDIKSALTTAEADIITFTGGSSVGERDLIVDAVGETGEVLFHGVAVKPGKPTLLGKVGDMLVLGMPGYPTSCLTVGLLLLQPMLRRMARLPSQPERKVCAVISAEINSPENVHQLLTVKLEGSTATPAFRGSSAITSMSSAHGFVQIPAGVIRIEKGEEVEVTLL